jgi:hypothetical protein
VFTEAQLQAIAKNYDPALHEAPCVVGHPAMDAPAYGWAKSLSVVDGRLQAEPQQVDAAFGELVNAGRFKKISAAFYAPEDPANPKPGDYYLRHIGFLGAKAPAVKGLKSAEFGDDGKNVIEFMDWDARDIASLFRSLREWFIGAHGQEVADKVVPEYTVTALTENAARTDTPTETITGAAYSEQEKEAMLTKEQQLAAQETELKKKAEEQAARDLAFAEREKKVKDSEAAQRRTVIVADVEALVVAGKLLPKDKLGLVAFMEALPVAALAIEFGEGDKKVKTPPIDWLRGFLKALPKAVEFRERGADAGGEQADTTSPEHEAAQLARLSLEFTESEAKAGRVVNSAQAVAHVKAKLAR